MEQECEIGLQQATEVYKENLSKFFYNRNEPLTYREMFKHFTYCRDKSIEHFIVNGEIRQKFEKYDFYLDNLQSYIDENEKNLLNINEKMAMK